MLCMCFVSAKPYTAHSMTLNTVDVPISLFSRLCSFEIIEHSIHGKFIFSRIVCFYQFIVLIQI